MRHRLQFTAAQAAQKIAGAQWEGPLKFTAAQAAQKVRKLHEDRDMEFTAAQAAQKQTVNAEVNLTHFARKRRSKTDPPGRPVQSSAYPAASTSFRAVTPALRLSFSR